MIVAEYSQKTKVPLKAIWEKWTDVASWKYWNEQIEFSDLDGPFDEKSTGILKHIDGVTTIFIIEQVDQFKKFVDVSKQSFGKIKCHHAIKRVGNQTEITQRIELCSPLACIYGFFHKKMFYRKLKNTVKKLINIVEIENATRK